MTSQPFDLVVIGGGPAGVTAALRAAELGARTALVERGLLGGACTNDGCVPTRVLARAARLRRDAEQFGAFGLEGEPPSVDFRRLIERAQHSIYAIHEKKQLLEHLHAAAIEVYANAQAQFANAHTVRLSDGTEIRADKFIISVGGHARRLDFPGSDLALTHSDIWSLDHLPRSIIIVGGAATGCQLASIFDSLGSRVTLLNRDARILPVEDGLVSQTMAEEFQKRGIETILSIGAIERIERDSDGLRLDFLYNGAPRSLSAEAIVLSVGWVGNLDELNLAAAGVKTERGYISVDNCQQTSVPHIFAAGDITGRMMLVQSGSYEGRLAAENAILGSVHPYTHQIVPHGGFTDPEYAGVGLTEEQARAKEECAVAVVPFHSVDRAVIDNHSEGFCKLIVSVESHRILGAYIVGEQALEAIQVVAAGMAADMWVEQLAEVELAYPTYTAIVGLAARQVCRQLGVVPLTTHWHALPSLASAEWEWASGGHSQFSMRASTSSG